MPETLSETYIEIRDASTQNRVVTVIDGGRILNPLAGRNQIEGAAVMGICDMRRAGVINSGARASIAMRRARRRRIVRGDMRQSASKARRAEEGA